MTGVYFSGDLHREQLTCFGNQDYLFPSYYEAAMCLVGIRNDCSSLWGTRTIALESEGNVEVFRVKKIPIETPPEHAYPMNASRWVQLSLSAGEARSKEVKQIAAEPAFFCARCNDWKENSTARFSLRFRPAFIREKDMAYCQNKLIILGCVIAILARQNRKNIIAYLRHTIWKDQVSRY